MKRPAIIFCDIDGTLLLNGSKEVSPAVFAEIERLKGLGVQFCPASGRQYYSLRRLFPTVEDEVYYLCENGAIVLAPGSPGKVLSKTVIERNAALALCQAILDDPRCELLTSGENMSYVAPKTAQYEEHLRYFVGNRLSKVSRVADIPEDIVKISACCFGGPTDTAAVRELLRPLWEPLGMHADTAGYTWLDFTLATKGDGVRCLCSKLGIDPADAMAIGDTWNDRSMLEAVGMPVVMESGTEELKAMFPMHARCVEELLAQIV